MTRTYKYILLFITAALNLLGQGMGTGTITGRVTDPSGAVVPGVQITAVHLATNTARTATTNDQGNYVLPDLQVGKYLVKAEHPGFKSFAQQNVNLDADAIATVNIALEIGTSQETVTVSSAPPAIQTESGEISNLVTRAGQRTVAERAKLFSVSDLQPRRCFGANRNAPRRRAGRQSAALH